MLAWSRRGAEPPALAQRSAGAVGEHLGVALCLLGCEHALLLFPQVLLRVKESEIQYLKQEISSLKDELQTALRVMPGDISANPLTGCGLLLSVCARLDSSSLVPTFETTFNFSPEWD